MMESGNAIRPSDERPPRPQALRNFSYMAKEFPTLRILVVDDELLIRWSLAETLSKSGHTVIEASDGATALRVLREQGPVDVVLLDFRLPDSDDLTLLSNIRRLSPSSSVVMMTAYGTAEVTRDALDLGACLVLSKPFDLNDIPAVVASAHGTGPH